MLLREVAAERMKPSFITPGSPDLLLPLGMTCHQSCFSPTHTSTQTHTECSGFLTRLRRMGCIQGASLRYLKHARRTSMLQKVSERPSPSTTFVSTSSPVTFPLCSPSRLPLALKSWLHCFPATPSVTGIGIMKRRVKEPPGISPVDLLCVWKASCKWGE